jgi:HD-GYP domain-containing protein (c-di-GMP phosphodiesterase class II)
MSETQVLLNKIGALRQRLEHMHGMANEAGSAAAELLSEPDRPGLSRLWSLEQESSTGADCSRQIDAAVKPVVPSASERPSTMPTQLTARARRVLEQGRELLQSLKRYQTEPLVHEAGGVLTALYHQTTALTEAGLRLVTTLPDSPTRQLQLSEGIEALFASASQRLGSLDLAVHRQHEEAARIERLALYLDQLEVGADVELHALRDLAESLLIEAAESFPLRFIQPPAPVASRSWVARLVAGHSLTVGQVMARLVRNEPELRSHAVEAVLAALLHDAGMLHVSPALLAHAGPLDEEGKRAIEQHCPIGARLVSRLLPDTLWLIEAAGRHHERSNGTGYPDGVIQSQISPMVRLLSVCDVYAAGCQARPHRPPRETRTALTDTLLLAEQGLLDRHFAERLLQLSFYPIGSVVELADGALAAVIGVPGTRDLNAPARPIIAVLTDSQGRFLPSPRYLDLSRSDSHSIVRNLSMDERRRILGTRYPEWAL